MQTLISAAQDLTGSWVDLGSPIKTRGMKRIGTWLVLDINDSLNARVRAQAQLSLAATEGEFDLPIKVVSASDVKVEDEYLEWNVDADQNTLIAIEVHEIVPWIQLQVQAGTVGATAGKIAAAYATFDNF